MLSSPIVPGANSFAQYEYLQTELITPLIAGEIYRVAMWVAHADRSRLRAPDLGIHLSADNSFSQTPGNVGSPITLTPTLNNPYGGFITSRDWILFESISLPLNPNFSTYGSGFYLIDSVSVTSAVPKPASFGLGAVALVALAGFRVPGRAKRVREEIRSGVTPFFRVCRNPS